MNNPIEVRGGNQLLPQRVLPVRLESTAQPHEDRLDLRSIYFALRRQQHIILITVALFLALAIAATALQTPKFVASSRVVLNTSDMTVAPKLAGDAPSTLPTSDVVDTEVEVFSSPDLASSVAQALDLDRSPTFNPLLNPHGSRLHDLLHALGLARRATPVRATADMTRRAVIAKLIDGLSVQRIGTTYAFNISMKATDAHDAQAIANEYAQQYTQYYVGQKRASGSAATAFLSRRLEELRGQAQADTARVQQYRIANNLLSTSGASLTEQEISTYNQEVAGARAQAAEDRARLDTARSQLRAGSQGDDVGEALNSPVVSALRAKRSEVSGRLASLEAQFGPLYPPVQRARSELDDVDAQIAAEIKRIGSNLQAKVEVSSGRLASIEGSLGSARGQLTSNNRAMVGLDDLTRRAEASQQLYDSYLAQYKETVARQGTEQPQARIIADADLPPAPASPKPVLNVILALVIGTGIGVVIALIREMLYSGLSTAADVESRLSCRCLGSIPLLKSIDPSQTSPISAIVQAPQSGFTEAFRGLRTSIQYAVGGPSQVLMITSALPREGKSTISVCLARLAALNNERVVLVDVDPRRRGASSFVRGASNRPGLVEVLRGQATLDEALIQDDASTARILPISGAVEDLGDLIIGEEMELVISELRRRFNLVLLDAAPVLPIADTRALAAKVDAVVIVARWRATADHAIRSALGMLPHDRVSIAGVVLSQVDIRKQSKYGYGDAGFYHAMYKDYYQ